MRQLTLAAIITFIALLIAPIPRSLACTYEPHEPPPLIDRVAQADTIFVGTVAHVIGDIYEQTAIIRVTRYLKGGDNQPALIVLEGFGDSDACMESVSEGEQRIFYAANSSDTLGLFALEYYDVRAATEQVVPALIDEILSFSGQRAIIPLPDTQSSYIPTLLPELAPTLTPEPSNTPTPSPEASSSPLPILLILIPFSILSGIAAWLILFRRRPC